MQSVFRVKNYFRPYSVGMERAETTATPPKKEKPKEEIPFGLELDLNDCYNEFAEKARVLPFVPRPKAD